jgi:hypothetical protein
LLLRAVRFLVGTKTLSHHGARDYQDWGILVDGQGKQAAQTRAPASLVCSKLPGWAILTPRLKGQSGRRRPSRVGLDESLPLRDLGMLAPPPTEAAASNRARCLNRHFGKSRNRNALLRYGDRQF